MSDRVRLTKIAIALASFFIFGSFQQSLDVYASPDLVDPMPIRDWTYQNVEGSNDMGRYPALAVDPQGNPHIGYYDYTNGDIRYTYWMGDEWKRETVKTGGLIEFISMALDDTTPHMLFGRQRLTYAYRADTGWHTETIRTGSTVAFRSGSLAVDDAGNPHVVYYDYDNGVIQYAHRTESGWLFESLGERDNAFSSTSITIDKTGKPHIAFVLADTLNYVYYSETGWQPETIDTGYPTGVSIQLGNNDQPQISYKDHYKDEIRHASRSTGSWEIEIVDSTTFNLSSDSTTSLAISPGGIPYISYFDDGLEKMKVANRKSGSWTSEFVEDVAGVGEFSSIDFDNSDHLHIAYYDGSIKALKYADRSTSGWEIQVVHPAIAAGGSFAMALDNSDNPNLVYTSGGYEDIILRYDQKTANGWAYDSVYHSSNIRGASLVLDSNESPHASFFDEQTTDFIYAFRSEAGWITETVDTGGHDTGLNALAVDNQDEPRLAYFVETPSFEIDLRYAERTASGWMTQTLKTVAIGIPGGISVKFDSADQPHLVYSMAGIWYGWHNGTDWSFEPVDDYLRTKVSLELDSSDNAQLCYQKDFNLIYAQNKVDNWDYDTVDNSQDTGFNCSLALDSDDYPHISYFDRGNSTFMYASLIEDSWFIESVAEESNPLSSRPDTVLQLDSAGNPHIATSTMVFLRNVLRILSGGELYVPRWLYLPNIFR